MSNGLILEFAGLPGAGKSTVATEVIKILERRGLRVARDPAVPGAERARQLRGGYLRFLACQPAFVWNSCRAILRSRQRSKADLGWTTVTWLKRAARLSRALGSPELRLLDPGISQALWSIGLRAQSDTFSQLASALLEAAPLPHLVAVVDADDQAIISRLRARPGSTSRLERQELAAQSLLVARKRLEEVLGALERLEADRPEVLHTVNDHGRTPSACALEVATWLVDSHDLSSFEVRE